MTDFLFKWVIEKFKDYVLRNWKTTLVGLLGAMLTQVPILAPYKEAIVAAIIAAVGLLSKDADKSGTTSLPRVSKDALSAIKKDYEPPKPSLPDRSEDYGG